MNVIHLISDTVWGGGERYASAFCRALRADGHAVKVFTRKKTSLRNEFAREGLLGGTLPLGGAWDFISPICLASALRRMPGDTVIHAHNFRDAYTALAARRLCRDRNDIRVVATQHTMTPAGTGASALRTYNELDAIIFVSEAARSGFMSTSPAVDPSRLHVVCGGVDVEPCEPHLVSDGPCRLIYIGDITPDNGLDVLLESLRNLGDKDWTLDIFGTGNGKYVLPLVAMSEREFTDGRVHWLGRCNDEIAVLRNAHVAVMPWRRPEASPTAILEAFSQEVVVLCSECGVAEEIIRNSECGWLVPVSDTAFMAMNMTKALEWLIPQNVLRQRMARECLEAYIRDFSFERFYNDIIGIYRAYR